MANKEMTSREFFTAVVNGTITEEVKTYAQTAIKKLDAKNEKRKEEGSKTAQANKVIKEAILAAMEKGVTYTAAEVAALGVEGITSTQKASALMRQIVTAGQAIETEIKIKGKGKVKGYTKVDTETETAEE